LFPDASIVSSVARFWTHATLFPSVSLGYTIGTSGCAKHSFVEKDRPSLEFATKTYDLLRQDLARGEGEYLNAYINTFDCQPRVVSALVIDLRQTFAQGLYQSEEPVDLVIATRGLISARPERQAYCS
jgi:hypothetical protein